jgi:hypothetical protein
MGQSGERSNTEASTFKPQHIMSINEKVKGDLQVSYHDENEVIVLEIGDASSDDEEFQDDPERAKRILRAVDIRLVPGKSSIP